MKLDFSAINDDQLVELIRMACEEAVRRGEAVAVAAEGAFLSEAEKLQITRAAAEKARAKIRDEEIRRQEAEAAAAVRREADQRNAATLEANERRIWARRKGIALALANICDVKGDQIVVWSGPDKEKRVFFQVSGFGTTWATLYVTGNNKHPPDSILYNAGTFKPEIKAQLAAVLREIAKQWTTIKIDLKTALAWEGDAVPLMPEQPTAPKAEAQVATP